MNQMFTIKLMGVFLGTLLLGVVPNILFEWGRYWSPMEALPSIVMYGFVSGGMGFCLYHYGLRKLNSDLEYEPQDWVRIAWILWLWTVSASLLAAAPHVHSLEEILPFMLGSWGMVGALVAQVNHLWAIQRRLKRKSKRSAGTTQDSVVAIGALLLMLGLLSASWQFLTTMIVSPCGLLIGFPLLIQGFIMLRYGLKRSM
jgi:hypothetical protein